jgi:hypothetical protein
MGAKWTPGPWAYDRDSAAVYFDDGDVNPTICFVERDNAEDAQTDADGHLIAAAPDLYAALDDLLAVYAEPDKRLCCGGQDCGCQGATAHQQAEYYARAALAKARGEA